MKFQEGHSKKGGRKKGTLNKITTSIKQKLFSLIDGNIDTLQLDLNALTPQERISTFLKLLEYAMPKQKESAIDISNLTDEQVEQLIDNIISKQHE